MILKVISTVHWYCDRNNTSIFGNQLPLQSLSRSRVPDLTELRVFEFCYEQHVTATFLSRSTDCRKGNFAASNKTCVKNSYGSRIRPHLKIKYICGQGYNLNILNCKLNTYPGQILEGHVNPCKGGGYKGQHKHFTASESSQKLWTDYKDQPGISLFQMNPFSELWPFVCCVAYRVANRVSLLACLSILYVCPSVLTSHCQQFCWQITRFCLEVFTVHVGLFLSELFLSNQIWGMCHSQRQLFLQ